MAEFSNYDDWKLRAPEDDVAHGPGDACDDYHEGRWLCGSCDIDKGHEHCWETDIDGRPCECVCREVYEPEGLKVTR